MFSRTAAAKGQDAEYKRAAAVAIGCVMLKVTCSIFYSFSIYRLKLDLSLIKLDLSLESKHLPEVSS